MRSATLFFVFVLAIAVAGCEVKTSSGNDGSVKTKTVTSDDNSTLNGAIIKNDIDLEVTGVKLKEAYLMDAERNLIAENSAKLGERIYLVIKLDTGWTKENGKSFIGASERILTPAGRVVVNADDIFKEYETTGLDAKDARLISLSAVITEADAGLDNFTVHFRVWDKKGAGEVKGKYKFSLKK